MKIKSRFIKIVGLLAVSLVFTALVAVFAVCVGFFVNWGVDVSLLNPGNWTAESRGVLSFWFVAIFLVLAVRSLIISDLQSD